MKGYMQSKMGFQVKVNGKVIKAELMKGWPHPEVRFIEPFVLIHDKKVEIEITVPTEEGDDRTVSEVVGKEFLSI